MVNNYLGIIFSAYKYLNTDVPKSNMVVVYPLKVPSLYLMMCSEYFKFDINYVNRSLPKIISYLPLADSYQWHFHVTTFSVLSVGKVKYTLTVWLVVMFPAYVCHCVTEYYSVFSFSTSLTITIVELYPLSNSIKDSLNLYLPILVSIHLSIIGE